MSDKPVLFVHFRPLERSENLNAIYSAYNGPKVHICTHDDGYEAEVLSGKYDLMVIDEFPTVTPGKCIMIWHAIQGGKLIGTDQPRPYYQRSAAVKMTKIVTAGTGTIAMFSGCTGVPTRDVLALGMPRTDQYIGKRKGDGGTPLAGYNRVYLYVPTFRWQGETPFPDIDWDYIDSQLHDDEILAVKVHPMTYRFGIKRYKHIIELYSNVPSAQYLYDCDVVITDYSSIMFDGYLLGKPCVLFEKTPGYTRTRGMYLRYPDQYSSRFATNEQELITLARSADKLTATERSCIDCVADMCDGHSCERIISLINQLKGE